MKRERVGLSLGTYVAEEQRIASPAAEGKADSRELRLSPFIAIREIDDHRQNPLIASPWEGIQMGSVFTIWAIAEHLQRLTRYCARSARRSDASIDGVYNQILVEYPKRRAVR
jgi:hypothetical protein